MHSVICRWYYAYTRRFNIFLKYFERQLKLI